MIKVAVMNGNIDTLKDPILGRPFSSNLDRVEYTEDFTQADWILGNLDYLECNRDYGSIAQSRAFQLMPEKFVFWSMHDSPKFAYNESRSLKFLCQPMAPPEANKIKNIVSVPLQMRHYERELISDIDFIQECRNTEKEYDFVAALACHERRHEASGTGPDHGNGFHPCRRITGSSWCCHSTF